jgi:DNA-binding transcriptional LysR family regulator
LSPVIRQLLLDSDLVTILPLVVVENEISTGALKVLPFDDSITFPIHLTQRQTTYPSPARDYVVGELEQLFRELAGRQVGADARPRPRISRERHRL